MEEPKTTQAVCAVIVTYHPSTQNIEHIPSVFAQVQGLVVVDNGSTEAEVSALRKTSRTFGFHLIENAQNLGIAEALNQGVQWAKDQGFPWVILFDQDSTITSDFVPRMLAAWQSHPKRAAVASVQPKYVMPGSGVETLIPRASDGGPATAMTSGTLLPIWIFDKIGFFASEYFIDLVDCEYSLRIRAAGYLLAEATDAVLLHCAGHEKNRLSFFGFSFGPSHHSAMRRYYISRNRVVVYRKYFFKFPGWTLHSMNAAVRETIKCFVGEQDRARKFRNFLLGTWDGLIGRMGKREGL